MNIVNIEARFFGRRSISPQTKEDTVITLQRTVVGKPINVETHDQPHLDEIAAMWLVERFASQAWLNQHCPEGTLRLGVGRGEFDEHADAGKPAKADECCLTLVAKSLGVQDNPALIQLIKFVYNVDAKGGGHPFDLYNMVKMLNLQFPTEPERVIEWAVQALEAKYAEQSEFAASVAQIKRASLDEISLHGVTNGPVAKIMTIESDRRMILAAAIADRECRLDVIIQKRSDNRVMIMTSRNSGYALGEVVWRLRVKEKDPFAQESAIPWEQRRDLSCEGFGPNDERWFYAKRGEMILNGSHTAPNVPPTGLTLKEIQGCVRRGLLPQLRQRAQKQTTNITPIAEAKKSS
ncbi:MAG: hypothetical protein HY092_03810 [Candidatus Kerfeldbacteria bacterium]|nr:hypothetical protein [Candidatus Kerfeldbacteria bacterium]